MSWSDLLTGLGLAAVIEGLALSLAPRRIDEVLIRLAQLPSETRRMLGLAAVALGVGLVALARGV